MLAGLKPGHRMAEMELRLERRGLLSETLDQFGRVDSRIARDVEDRLFGIERGALPARRRERVEHGAAHFEHAALEHREEPDRPGADDRDIAILGLGRGCRHGASRHERVCCRAV